MKLKSILLTVAALAITASLLAQNSEPKLTVTQNPETTTTVLPHTEQAVHEFGIQAAGGLSTLQYNLQNGTQKMGVGGQFGLTYSYFFTPNIALNTGVGAALYQAKADLQNFTDSYEVITAQAINDHTYSYSLINYRETQQLFAVHIPLMLQLQTSGKHRFYVAAGGKLSLPVALHARATDDFIVHTEAYFPHENVTYDDVVHFGPFSYSDKKNSLDNLKINAMLAAEFGVKWRIGNTNAMYTGIYFDYGLMNIQKTNDKIFVSSTPETTPPVTISSVMETKNVDKITTMAAGVTIRYVIGQGLRNTGKPRMDIPAAPIVEVLDDDKDGVANDKDKCPGTSAEAFGQIDETGCPKDSDGDNVADYVDKCPGTPAEAFGQIDETGCPKDSDNDGIADYLDNCPGTAGVKSNNGCPEIDAATKKIFEKALHGIQFETGKDVIKPASYPVLNDIVRIMNENPNYTLSISGHTDNVGDEDKNQILSENRANAVKTYLIAQQIAENRIISEGFGESRPVAPNDTEANRTQNRRVEFVVKFEE